MFATLVVLRFQLSYQALAELYQTSRFTVDRAVREIRRLLAARGFAVPNASGVRLRTLDDVFAIAEPKQWRSLQRWTGQHHDLPEVMAAIGGLVSDRAAKRATVHKPSTDLVVARPTAC